MTSRNPTRQPQGIRTRHSRACRSTDGGKCNCHPSYESWVFSKRDGKKVRKTFPTLAAAKSWRNDALTALDRGRFRAPVAITVREAADAWLDGVKTGTIRNRAGQPFKPSTLRGYERSLKLRVLPELGHYRLSDMRRVDVQDFADKLLASGLDPSTILNTIDPLRAIYRRAMQREQVAINPTLDLELPAPSGTRDRIASPQEARDLLDALPIEDRALWATALYAGLRRGELRGLRWSDVDLAARELHVRRGWDDIEGPIEGKSKAADRTVPIIGVLAPELAAQKLRTGRDGDALVFGATAERPFGPSTVHHRGLVAWRKAELKPIGLHECRHTFASLLIAAGVNAKAITEAMGHATITMTFDRYGHLMPGGRDEARERVDRYLASAALGRA